MKNILLLLTLLLFCGQGLTGQEKARYTQASQEIETIKTFAKAYNDGDWDKMAMLYAPQATIVHNRLGPSPATIYCR